MSNVASSTVESAVQERLISGVVEGFYGRPWTSDQREHLFHRLARLGLNTYLYAPKDDIKHRSAWRDLYNEEEIGILANLVSSAKSVGVTFVYAISPGLDIEYSSDKERETLKAKIEQVREMGCTSFAILFDDIERTMKEVDSERFDSFAIAQVDVSNDLFDYLEKKGLQDFYFCPTEYCSTRAIPNVATSAYLNTIGERLRPRTKIMWTGPRVISRELGVEHLKEVGKTLRRKPLIWDNLHANDYDTKRVFLGPYKGRSVLIKDYVSGILLNPNCRYETNFIPVHTMSDWFACKNDIRPDKDSMAPIGTLAIDMHNDDLCYNPYNSCQTAVTLWLHEFEGHSGPSIPQLPKIDLTTEGAEIIIERQKSETSSSTAQLNENSNLLPLEEIIQTIVSPELVDQSEELNSLSADYAQPMEEDEINTTMTPNLPETSIDVDDVPMSAEKRLADFAQVNSIVELFFLPFEHGNAAQDLLNDFTWLYDNQPVMNIDTANVENFTDTQHEWVQRFERIQNTFENVINFYLYLCDCSNKTLVSEVIPYVWEAHAVCVVVVGVIRWLLQGYPLQHETYESFWKNIGDEEPWSAGGGGVLVDLVRLMTQDGKAKELFYNKAVLPLSIGIYDIRTFSWNDEALIRTLSYTNMTKNEDILRLRSEMFCDRTFMPYLLSDADHCFVCEEINNTSSRRAICFATAHSKGYALQDFLVSYKEQMRAKYSEMAVDPSLDMKTVVSSIDIWFPTIQADVFLQYPAWVDCRFALDAIDAVPMKRLLQTIAVTLTMEGCSGMFIATPIDEPDRHQYFIKLGFNSLGPSECEKFNLLGYVLHDVPRLGRTPSPPPPPPEDDLLEELLDCIND